MDCRDRIVILSQHGVKLRNVFHSVNVFSPEEKGQSVLGVYILRVNRFYTLSNMRVWTCFFISLKELLVTWSYNIMCRMRHGSFSICLYSTMFSII